MHMNNFSYKLCFIIKGILMIMITLCVISVNFISFAEESKPEEYPCNENFTINGIECNLSLICNEEKCTLQLNSSKELDKIEYTLQVYSDKKEELETACSEVQHSLWKTNHIDREVFKEKDYKMIGGKATVIIKSNNNLEKKVILEAKPSIEKNK